MQIKEVNADWWMGQLGERKGLFPRSCCSATTEQPSACMVVASYDFTPDEEDKEQFLTLKEGDVFTAITTDEGSWWYGNLNGKQVTPLHCPYFTEATDARI